MRSIFLCRTISAYIRKSPIYGKMMADTQQHQSTRVFKSALYYHKKIYEKGVAYDIFQVWIIMLWRIIADYAYHMPINKKRMSIDLFANLSEDVQCIILSKLSLKEVVKTSVLSSKSRFLWTVSPKLRFDGATMFGMNMKGKQREKYTRQFINTVNAVLQQCNGRVVEEFAVKFEFDTLLVAHLNSWVQFGTSLHTKVLALDLTPRGLEVLGDPLYTFPFKLIDNRSITYLQHLQLHYMSAKMPTEFCGFPKLRKLDLYKFNATAKDFQDMLSNCCALEWLSIVHCKMYGDLKARKTLPCLLYLNVAFSELTKIEFHAVKLKTFTYEGEAVPISLSEAYGLRNANIFFAGATIRDSMLALADVLTNVKNLTFKIYVQKPEVPYLLKNSCKLEIPCLKQLQLLSYTFDVDNQSLISFLGAASLIEKLEIHFSSLLGFYQIKGVSIRRFQCACNYLKNVCITGFKASCGQNEFLVHIVENSPALEVLTIDPLNRIKKGEPLLVIEREPNFMDAAYRIARKYLEENIAPKCSLNLLF